MKVLIVVDPQHDFMDGGALAVPGANKAYREALEALMDSGDYELIVATQDWHPEDHGSFAPTPELQFSMGELGGRPQMLWPPHCMQGTFGANFPVELNVKFQAVVRKGMNPQFDSYSGIKDDGGAQTGLNKLLSGASEIHVCGLATDYCVKNTVLDILQSESNRWATVTVLLDHCRGINAETAQQAIAEMQKAGALFEES